MIPIAFATLPPRTPATTPPESSARASPPAAAHDDHPLVSIVVIEGVSELERYAADWEDLAREAIEPNVFNEPWMMLPALRAYSAGCRVLLALVFVRQP